MQSLSVAQFKLYDKMIQDLCNSLVLLLFSVALFTHCVSCPRQKLALKHKLISELYTPGVNSGVGCR